ncbi:MAG: hypothetical protein ISS19_03055 [Bacteroidales bacterium]|nr:hypothetical protein [Bacteroidales bacterium]
MKVPIVFFFTSLFLLSGCGHQKNQEVNDFWYGPHPEDEQVRFVIHFYSEVDSVGAHGYWLVNDHYNSDFEVIHLKYAPPALSFVIPSWGCEYTGEFINEDKISGCFSCEGERS